MHAGGAANIINFCFCVGISWALHLLEASFGRVLCTSCTFVMLVELTLATFFQLSTFVDVHPCVLLRLPRESHDSSLKRGDDMGS